MHLSREELGAAIRDYGAYKSARNWEWLVAWRNELGAAAQGSPEERGPIAEKAEGCTRLHPALGFHSDGCRCDAEERRAFDKGH